MLVQFKVKSTGYEILTIQPSETSFVEFTFDDGNEFTHWYNRLWAILKFVFTGKFKIEMIQDNTNLTK